MENGKPEISAIVAAFVNTSHDEIILRGTIADFQPFVLKEKSKRI